MHRVVRDYLEEVLADPAAENPAMEHLKSCGDCREEVVLLLDQSALLRSWRNASEAEPRAGFYARVMNHIDVQRSGSIWSIFFDSIFARRIAFASLALAVLLGGYVVSSERTASQDSIVQAVLEQPGLTEAEATQYDQP